MAKSQRPVVMDKLSSSALFFFEKENPGITCEIIDENVKMYFVPDELETEKGPHKICMYKLKRTLRSPCFTFGFPFSTLLTKLASLTCVRGKFESRKSNTVHVPAMKSRASMIEMAEALMPQSLILRNF